jgi:hypothetical protein
MANTQELCNSFKTDNMAGNIALGTDTLNAALYLATATINKSTTVYSATGEVTGTNYVAGGVAVTTANPPALDGDTAHFTPSASIVYSNVTLSTAFDAVLLYRATGLNAVSVHTFSSQTVTAGDFTLTMPTDDGTTGLIRLT